MPVNMRTHGHGQGYADINFLIPELVQSMRVRKGPYFADEGDFSSAGTLRIDYINTMNPGLWQGTLGMFGYGRALAIKSYPISAGTPWTGNSTATNPVAGNLLVAAEATAYDGPWDVPDRMKKLNGVLPVAPVLDLAQALDSPFLQTTEMIHTIGHPAKPGMRVLCNPIKIDGERLSQAPCSPYGADTAAYVGEMRSPERATSR